MELSVGKKYTFKVTPGRGRPFVGEVMSISDDLVHIKNRHDKIVTIPQNQVIREYIFKPYITKKDRDDA